MSHTDDCPSPDAVLADVPACFRPGVKAVAEKVAADRIRVADAVGISLYVPLAALSLATAIVLAEYDRRNGGT